MADNEMKEVNVNSMHHSQLGNDQASIENDPNDSNTDVSDASGISYDSLNDVMDILFSSSKEVLGNISSIGVKYGSKLDNPDHMLVIFSDEMVGFQSWNNRQKKCRWRYNKSTKVLQKNGAQVNQEMNKSFVEFVQAGLDAVQQNQVEFSKNITKDELKQL